MILTDIKQYLIDNRSASLADLSVRFHTGTDVMRGMLEHWIRKGKLRKLDNCFSCSGCCSFCKSDHTELYEWTDKRSK
ncbi:MAG: FeoC-like transcriptional regulator [Desulfobacteraceae bacterium]|jgi:hypothetical protein